MNRLQITYFLHLCGTLKISETARQLYVAQPAVSKQIARLEEELGYPLFLRTNRGLALTESGRILYEFFSEAAEQFNIADRNAKRSAAADTELTVGILENLGLDEALALIRELRETRPDISVKLVRLGNDALMRRLASQQIDIAITFDHAAEKGKNIRVEELLLEQSLFLLSRRHPLAQKEPLSPQMLSGELFCESWLGEEGSDEYLHRVIRLLGIRPRGYLTVENLASGIESIEANFTVGLIDERIQLPNPDRFLTVPTGIYLSIVAVTSNANTNTLMQPFVQQLKAKVTPKNEERT